MPETQDHTHVCTDVGLVPDIKDVNSRQRVVEMWEGIDVRECRNSPRTIGVAFLDFLCPSPLFLGLSVPVFQGFL